MAKTEKCYTDAIGNGCLGHWTGVVRTIFSVFLMMMLGTQ